MYYYSMTFDIEYPAKDCPILGGPRWTQYVNKVLTSIEKNLIDNNCIVYRQAVTRVGYSRMTPLNQPSNAIRYDIYTNEPKLYYMNEIALTLKRELYKNKTIYVCKDTLE